MEGTKGLGATTANNSGEECGQCYRRVIRTRSGASSNLIGRNDNLLAVRVGDELWSGGDANLWHLVYILHCRRNCTPHIYSGVLDLTGTYL